MGLPALPATQQQVLALQAPPRCDVQERLLRACNTAPHRREPAVLPPTCASPQMDPEHTACSGAFMPPAGTASASRQSDCIRVAVLQVTACRILAAGRVCQPKRETLNAWQWALERCFQVVKPSQQRQLAAALRLVGVQLAAIGS